MDSFLHSCHLFRPNYNLTFEFYHTVNQIASKITIYNEKFIIKLVSLIWQYQSLLCEHFVLSNKAL